MASINRVIVAGNLTRDPEVRYLPSGTAVCELGLAMNERVKRDDEWVEKPVFVDITVWGRQAEICGQYLSKGRGALIEGRLQLDQWEDKDGNKRSKLKVVAERVQFLGGRGEDGGGSGPQSGGGGASSRPAAPAAPSIAAPKPAEPEYEPPAESGAGDEDDLPF